MEANATAGFDRFYIEKIILYAIFILLNFNHY